MKKIVYIIFLIIIFIPLTILALKKDSSDNKIENYNINNIEDCKKLLPSIKTYCPSLQEIEPQFYEKNVFPTPVPIDENNPLSVLIESANLTFPATCQWFYRESPDTNINQNNPIEVFNQIILGKQIRIVISLYDNKTEATNQFIKSLNDEQISINEQIANGLNASIKKLSPNYFVTERKFSPAQTNNIFIGNSESKNKENIIIGVGQMYEENENPLCPENKIKELINSI